MIPHAEPYWNSPVAPPDLFASIFGAIPAAGFTLASWVRAEALTGNRGIAQVQNGGANPVSGSKPIGAWVNTSGQPWGRLIQANNTTLNLPQTGPAITTGINAQWHHVAYRGNGTTFEVFIDGSNVATASIAYDGTLLTHDTLFIGRQGGESWNGQLDDFRVYSRALSDTDIVELANTAIPEPSSIALIVLGASLTLLRRRK